jgi:rod shape determining protein RodA
VLFGLITLYSAGQTDVPTRAAGVWYRQFVWVGLGMIAAWVVFQVSPRILEWLAPTFYGFSLLLLVVVLLVGTGAGTAQSSNSWLSIGGHQIGQPSELAKVATVLMLARFLSSRKEPPRSLKDLIGPGIIVGAPFLLVMAQPDLGSAIVFIGILFAMLFWAGVRPRLLFLVASPGLSLLLAFSTWAWGAWIVMFTALLFVWRPYLSDGLIVWFLNVAMGTIALPLWQRLAPYQQNRLLTFLNPEVDPRAAGYHAIQSRVAIGSGGWFGNRLHRGASETAGVPAGAAHGFHLPDRGGGAGVHRRGGRPGPVSRPLPRAAAHLPSRHRPVQQPGGIRDPGHLLHPCVRERGYDGEPDADHRHPAPVLLLRRLLPHHLLHLSGAGLPGGLRLQAVRLS